MDYVPELSPRWTKPLHLLPAVQRLEKFRTEPFDFVLSVPPRHGKTELILHFIIWALKQDPTLKILYVSYSADQATEKSRRALGLADRAGLALESRAVAKWVLGNGEGMVQWTGVGGPITGKGFDIIIVDDPVKNRAEAESPTYRERAWDFYQSDLVTRLEPGSSFVCIQTRWHDDDLAGRLTKEDADEEEWEPLEYINLPAISNEESADEIALWPDRWPLEALHRRKKKVGSYAWVSLFQGHPRPRGSTVFGDPTFYTELPRDGFSVSQGLDLAYTEKKRSDHSVIVTMFAKANSFYVVRVRREQRRAPDFKKVIRLERLRFPRARCRIYAAGTELGALDFIKAPTKGPEGKVIEAGISIEVMNPEGDKFTRAIEFAEAWNDNRVMVPDASLIEQMPNEYAWVHEYLDELKSFTGVKDTQDDQVDASVSAFDVLNTVPLSYKKRDARARTPRRM